MDANDEAPQFTEPVKSVTSDENIPEKTLLYTFTAFDKDSPPNNEFRWLQFCVDLILMSLQFI